MRPPQQQAPSLAYPDLEQAVAFHQELARRLGAEDCGPINEAKLKGALERARDTVQHQRGDIITIAAFMFFGLVRDAPFGKGSTETGLALVLAFLMRHGVMIDTEDEELAGLTLAIADGQVFAGMLEQWMREYSGRGGF